MDIFQTNPRRQWSSGGQNTAWKWRRGRTNACYILHWLFEHSHCFWEKPFDWSMTSFSSSRELELFFPPKNQYFSTFESFCFRLCLIGNRAIPSLRELICAQFDCMYPVHSLWNLIRSGKNGLLSLATQNKQKFERMIKVFKTYRAKLTPLDNKLKMRELKSNSLLEMKDKYWAWVKREDRRLFIFRQHI